MSRLPILLAAVFLVGPTVASAQAPGPRVRMRLTTDTLYLEPPPALRVGGLWDRLTTPGEVAEQWADETLRLVELNRRAAWRRLVLNRSGLASQAAPAILVGPTPPRPAVPDSAVQERRRLSDLGRYADLNIELDAHLETRLDRIRNLNCTAADISNPASGCQGGFPTPGFDQQFALRAGGVIADRLNVNVDFDAQREFSSNNRINVWYQGMEDDVLRRVEVGNLDFQLPASRFIRSAIPAQSFGIQAEAQVGPLEIRSILAQQKGSSVRARAFTVGDQTTQEVSRESRDVEFEDSRFFFIVGPTLIPNYPNIDVLSISRDGLSPAVQIAQARVYRLRAQSGQVGINPSLQGIEAVAIREDSPQRVGPFFWDLLIEGQDYYLDPSGTWFGLRNRVGLDEFLAVSYVTVLGDTVGTFPSVTGPADTLQLIHEPRRGTEVPTFDHELRNFYRVGGNISRNSINLTLVVNDSERPVDGVGTYLARLGLANSTDPSQLDEFNRVFPRERDPNGGLPLRDLFVVFPNLRPFADSSLLQDRERNDSIYRTPTYLRSTEGPAPRFRFLWDYQASGSGDRSTLSLGAVQVRSGSERVRIGNRALVRGRDYEISYDLGTITFLNPDSLFPGPTQVQVQFEQNQLFDIAPSSVLGLHSTYNLGSRGRIDAVTLFQRERTIFTRPSLGFEPQAMFLGSLSTNLRFRPDFLTRVLNALPLLETNVPSTLEFTGELATSRPNPNQAGEAYIEEFEGQSSRFVGLEEQTFQLGSRPTFGNGVPLTHLSALGQFDAADAAAFVWQNAIEINGDPLELGPQEIDSSIVLTGASRPKETLLWLTLKPDTVGGAPHPITGLPRWLRPATPGPRWRSITKPLDRSGLGVDLSRIEFLEFWVLEDLRVATQAQQPLLVFDFGTVLEDAVAFGPDAFELVRNDTVFSGLQFLGSGALDSEKNPFTNLFNAAVNDVGIHGDLLPAISNITTGEVITSFPMCERVFTGVTIPAFPLGHLSARCTRRNGFIDSEDLNGDNRLDLTIGVSQEDVVRYVVPLGDPRLLVRRGEVLPDIAGATRTWRLYRVPFRRDTVQIGSPDLRRTRSLRITMVSSDRGSGQQDVSLALARLKLVGAPWLKRAETPIAGLGGFRGEPHGEVIASVISTEDRDLAYTSPPGVADEAARRGATFEFGSQQINERSLRLIARDLRAGERAEALLRFAGEADKNFLQYRTLRAWARGRGPGWEAGDLRFIIKVGSDEDNFYMYQTTARTLSWEPEVVVELERWLELRAQVENSWVRGESPSGSAECGGDSTAFVRCDGPYLIQVKDPGIRPPNLARVSEISVGILRTRESVFISEAEMWVDDIRLGDVVADAGFAGMIEARLTAADFAEVDVSFVKTDDRFRQVDETPDYLADTQSQIGATVRVDKLLPQSFGLSVPFTARYSRLSTDPFFVQRTDVRASALANLRKPGASATLLQLALRRSRRGETLAERLLLDPVSLVGRKEDAENVSELNSATARNRQLRAEYDNRPSPRTIRGVPSFVANLAENFPGWLRDSEFGKALRSSRLRWNPYQIRFGSELIDNDAERSTFRVPVGLPEDTLQVPLRSIVHTWRNSMVADVRPFPSLGVRVDYAVTRDLQDYGDSTQVGTLVGEQVATLAGRNIGFERDRSLSTRFNAAPVVNSWMRPRFNIVSTFNFHRDPNARAAVQTSAGSAVGFKVPEAVSNARTRLVGSTFDLSRLAEVLTGDMSVVARLMHGVFPADVTFQRERRSTFDRIPFTPSFRYQLALGGNDEFREQQGELATSAIETGAWTVSGGSQLPAGFGVRVNFRQTQSHTWARRGASQTEIEQQSREWPSGVLSWVYTPPGQLRNVISSVTAQARYRRTEASSFQPGALGLPGQGTQLTSSKATGVLTQSEFESVTPTVTLTWVAGVVTTARVTRLQSEVLTSGNVTMSDEIQWGGTTNFSFRAPRYPLRLPNEVRSSLTLTSTNASLCLQRTGSGVCSTVSESRRRQVDVRLDTGFPPSMRGGVTFSYLLREERHTSSKVSQMVLTIFLDINFLASQVR